MKTLSFSKAARRQGNSSKMDGQQSNSTPSPPIVEELEELYGEPSAENRKPTEVTAVIEHYAAAVRHYLRDELDQALDELRKAGADGEEPYQVKVARAQIYLGACNFEKAVESYREIAALEPGNGTAHYNLGLALEATEGFQEARSAFEAATKNDPDLTDAHLGRAGCSLKLNDLPKAKESYHQYLVLEPSSYDALFGLGVVSHLGKEHEEAVQRYTAALEVRPSSEEALSNLANVFTEIEQYADAANCYRQLLQLDSDSLHASQGLAYSCHRQGLYSTARTYYKQLVRLSPGSFDGWYNLGVVNQELEE